MARNVAVKRNACLRLARSGTLLVCVWLCMGGAGDGQEARGKPLPEGDGKELVAFACSQCHGLRETQLLRDSEQGWAEVVDRMVLLGAQLTPAEAARITHYLGTELGPGRDWMAGSAGAPHGRAGEAQGVALPPGPGQALVASRCVLCHGLDRVTGVDRSPSDWAEMTRSMLRGVDDSPAEIDTMIAYLQTNFSPGHHATRPASVQVAASLPSKTVFARNCQLCHSVEAGKELLGPSLYAEMREPHPLMNEQQVRSIIQDGRGKMPAFKDILTKEDTDDLIAYIRSL